MFIHISCAQLSIVPCSSPTEPQPSSTSCSRCSEHPGAAARSGRTLAPLVGSLFRTRYSPPSGNPFELLNCTCLLPSDRQDAWSVSSVKGFLKYKVLMKSCLVGEQYCLTRLLKKVFFKVPKDQLQVFQRPGRSKCSPMAYKQSSMKSREAGEQGTLVPCFDMQVFLNLQRAKKQLGQKPTPSFVSLLGNLGPVQPCCNQRQPLEQQGEQIRCNDFGE